MPPGGRRSRGVRVTGGELGGRSLPVPPSTRPTEGRLREALFSMWTERLGGARVLDLFAGSGVVGIEAVSRGALAAVLVEHRRRAVEALGETLAGLGLEGVVTVRRARLPGGLERMKDEGARFELIFADPPYAYTGYGELVAAVAPLLASDGEVALEHAARVELPLELGELVRVDRRRYGESALTRYRPWARDLRPGLDDATSRAP